MRDSIIGFFIGVGVSALVVKIGLSFVHESLRYVDLTKPYICKPKTDGAGK